MLIGISRKVLVVLLEASHILMYTLGQRPILSPNDSAEFHHEIQLSSAQLGLATIRMYLLAADNVCAASVT